MLVTALHRGERVSKGCPARQYFQVQRPAKWKVKSQQDTSGSSVHPLWKTKIIGGLLAGCAMLAGLDVQVAFARIPTDVLITMKNTPRPPSPEELIGAQRGSFQGKKFVPEDVEAEVKKIMMLMKQGKEAGESGDYEEAVKLYSTIIKEFPDLAVTEYARVSRALMLYQTGETFRAILELNDEEVALRGNPEVHSALAVILYVEKPSQLARAEYQWDLAMSFDKRYANPEWVASQKGWPPKLMKALDRFLNLQ